MAVELAEAKKQQSVINTFQRELTDTSRKAVKTVKTFR